MTAFPATDTRAVDEVVDSFSRHRAALDGVLQDLTGSAARLDRWASLLHERLTGGHRLLVAGNGGSAAQAQHLAAELVGRFRSDRPAFSAVALTADSATTTALANDYGVDEMFARQVEAHGRDGDVLLALSTSGRSPNVLRAVEAANQAGLVTVALTGARPNPLSDAVQDTVAVGSFDTALIQEAHQVLIHVLCEAFDARIFAAEVVR